MNFLIFACVTEQLADCEPLHHVEYSGECTDPDDALHSLNVRMRTWGVIDYFVVECSFTPQTVDNQGTILRKRK